MARNWGGAGVWGGLLNTSNNALQMGMGLMGLQQQREHQQALEANAAAQLKMQQESHQQNMAVNAMKMQEAKKLQEEYEKPLDMTMHPMFLGLPKESKDAALQSMYQMGLVNEAGIGKTGDIMKGVKNIMATEDLGKMVMEPIVAQRKEVALQAYNELQEEMAKPNANPEKIKTLTAQFNKVNGAYQSSAGGFTKWLEDVQKNTQAKELEMMKEKFAMERTRYEQGQQNYRTRLQSELNEKAVLKPMIQQLPKMQTAAQEANRNVEKYETLYKMADKGAAGLVPSIKATLAPAFEALGQGGELAKVSSEAQAFQLMARVGAAGMRTALIGPGQVSNYEQDLMQKISGGSAKTSREAAKSLFKYYANEARKQVNDYNSTLDLMPGDVTKYYKKIGTESGGKVGRFTVEAQ